MSKHLLASSLALSLFLLGARDAAALLPLPSDHQITLELRAVDDSPITDALVRVFPDESDSYLELESIGTGVFGTSLPTTKARWQVSLGASDQWAVAETWVDADDHVVGYLDGTQLTLESAASKSGPDVMSVRPRRTFVGAPVTNDTCASAVSLAIPSTTSGSTFTSSPAAAAPFCGTPVTSPGAWYTVVGDGSVLTASTCNMANFDTKVGVYTGSCAALSCVAGVDDAVGCAGFTSSVDWISEVGTVYYILVHGFLAATGDFTLAIETEPVPDFSLCETAADLPINSLFIGSTVGALDPGLPFCMGSSQTSGGLFFRVTGTGEPFVASTDFDGTDFDTKITVWTGECGALSCVVTGDDIGPGGGNLQTRVEWDSELGTEYLVYVHGFGSFQGAFELWVHENCTTNAPAQEVLPGSSTASLIVTDPTMAPPYTQAGIIDSTIAASVGTIFVWSTEFEFAPNFILGADVYMPPLAPITMFSTDGLGDAEFPLPIPRNVGLYCGAEVILQAMVLPLTNEGTPEITNAIKLTFGS